MSSYASKHTAVLEIGVEAVAAIIGMISKESLPAYVVDVLETVRDVSTSAITGEVLTELPAFGIPGV